ncbi:MAG: hypothetical protein ACOVRG_08295 [Saprospiraceae bacterium]|jgi:hypothetical protein
MMMNNFKDMNNKMSSWDQVSEELNKLEQTPSNEVWVRIQQKKIKRRFIRLSYSSIAATFLLIVGLFLFNQKESLSFSGYSYEPGIEQTEAESFLASITFSNAYLQNGKVAEGTVPKMLVPKNP